jgi:Fe-S-cluster containining protein
MSDEHRPAPDAADDGDLAAGDFASWVVGMQGAIRGEHGSDVPCGGCTACCTSSQFIHIDPDEADTLSHIPAELLFPAPRLPRGHVLLGYDEQGHCPMLVDGACSIYEHRPRTCRTYDCRVFPAAGVELDEADDADDADQVLIARRARRWRFSFPTPDDQIRHDAARAAATFLRERRDELPDGDRPVTPTQLAVLAIALHDLFVQRDDHTGRARVVEPDPREVRVELTRRRGTREPT